MKKVLTIAGSDCSGGAGIQADLKTMCAHGVYGMSVIAALTAQNTLGVQGIHVPPPEFVAMQIDSIFGDIRPDAVKIGMLANKDIIMAVVERLGFYKPQCVVLDPVMVSTSGHKLLADDAAETLINEMMPLANVITPNIPEAEVLSGIAEISDRNMMRKAAGIIADKQNSAVLVKGGHLTDCADDLLLYEGKEYWFSGKRIDTNNTHGTGCTLSSAIACELALEYELPEAVKRAKDYITQALENDPHIGHGNGPLNHVYMF